MKFKARHSIVAKLGTLAGMLLLIIMTTPGLASASTDTTDTSVTVRQVLPANGQNACTPLGVTAPHPYIYDGELNSFDVTITDPSYVAVAGAVGNLQVGYHFFSRWMNPDGTLRIHTDVYRMPVTQNLPVSITLISVKNGVTCVATVTTSISGATPVAPSTNAIPGAGQSLTSAGLQYQPANGRAPARSRIEGRTGARGSAHANAIKNPIMLTPSTSASSAPMFVGALHSLGNACAVGGSVKLWVVLLVLYALFVLVLLLQAPEFFGERTYEWNAALILLVFLALLTFWYLSEACRAGPWVAIFASLIAFIGLIAGLFESGPSTPPPTPLLKQPSEQPKLGNGKQQANGKNGSNKV